MRILLDECVPWPMRHLLSGHECTNVQKQGWKGTKNGVLLALATSEFDLFITSDQVSVISRIFSVRLLLSWNSRQMTFAASAQQPL